MFATGARKFHNVLRSKNAVFSHVAVHSAIWAFHFHILLILIRQSLKIKALDRSTGNRHKVQRTDDRRQRAPPSSRWRGTSRGRQRTDKGYNPFIQQGDN
jgi:hypothetical protein